MLGNHHGADSRVDRRRQILNDTQIVEVDLPKLYEDSLFKIARAYLYKDMGDVEKEINKFITVYEALVEDIEEDE